MPPRRVAIVISNLEYGGAQRQAIELANAMDPARFDIHICSLADYVPLADLLHERERRLHVIPKKFKFDIAVVNRLAQLLKRLKIDIVHGYLFDAVIASRLAGRMARTKIVISAERNAEYELKSRQRLAYQMTRSCVDLILANSHAGARFNSKTLGHDLGQYRVVHNGVDIKRFAPRDAAAMRKSLDLSENALVIGMFASFKAQKNHELFFRAVARVITKLPSLKCVLVGDELHAGMHGSDAYKQKIDQLVDALGIRAICLFLGNRMNVEELYGACDVTVLPSHFEGTPNVLLESMASGVPVIATDVADNALIAPDGEVGFITPPGDEVALSDRLISLLTDRDWRQRMGARAREWAVQNYSVERMAEKTADVYGAALAGVTDSTLVGSVLQAKCGQATC